VGGGGGACVWHVRIEVKAKIVEKGGGRTGGGVILDVRKSGKSALLWVRTQIRFGPGKSAGQLFNSEKKRSDLKKKGMGGKGGKDLFGAGRKPALKCIQ